MDFNIIFAISDNTSLSDKREDTTSILLEMLPKNNLCFKNSWLATWQFKEFLKENKEGKHLRGS